tara:strand:- start:4572 stop:4760 length:189 start_codon:yes stop_codon:yes gene_type:complete
VIQSEHTISPVSPVVDDIELVALGMGESLSVLAGFVFLLECLVRHILELTTYCPAVRATIEV